MIDVFKRLLAVQNFQTNIDWQISRALVGIETDIIEKSTGLLGLPVLQRSALASLNCYLLKTWGCRRHSTF